ncbi:small ribosomal subunit protein bTHXm-like [Primulina huaijiensis]|uniref:small ribosomal subunit protein bTHXm-like n=1 Tax=Primulina huaijiensis TaxID=1492673 RepID=UPI003CC73B12
MRGATTFKKNKSTDQINPPRRKSVIGWCIAAARRTTAAVEHQAAFSSLETSTTGVPILCRRRNKKTEKRERFKGSYGNSRPKKEKKIERIKHKIEVPSSTPRPLPFKSI